MSILVDSGVVGGSRLPRDGRHAAAHAATKRAIAGRWGTPIVSDFLVTEAVTLVRTRAKSHALADDVAAFLLGETPYGKVFVLERVTADVFQEARDIFRTYADKELSFVDCTSIALVRAHDLDGILSFDRGFDGIIPRVDPAQPEP
ncbi:MAG: PIN domain-containing protein [Halobacteriales archaeon]|nr:PIN domain-containing protein [Halobacteriales archaeon]